MWHITLPGISGTVVVLLIMRLGHVMDAGYETILLLQNNANMETSDVIGTYVYREGILGGAFEYTTAIGLLMSIVSLVLITLANYGSRLFSENSLW